jgi:hypothetical protein
LQDLDGAISLSNVVTIKGAAGGKFAVHPNPVASRMYVQLPQLGRHKLTLLNAQGQQVWSTELMVQQSETGINISRNGLPAGLYTLVAATADGKWLQTTKVLMK